MSKKLTKEEFLKDFFREDETVTVKARELQALMTSCIQKDLKIKELERKIADIEVNLSLKNLRCQRLELENMQLQGTYSLDLSA